LRYSFISSACWKTSFEYSFVQGRKDVQLYEIELACTLTLTSCLRTGVLQCRSKVAYALAKESVEVAGASSSGHGTISKSRIMPAADTVLLLH